MLSRYQLLLDVFPLTDDVRHSSPALADLLQRETLLILLDDRRGTHTLETLLCIARDLSYLDDDVAEFLLVRLRRTGRGRATMS
jgi:hypothetical protein